MSVLMCSREIVSRATKFTFGIGLRASCRNWNPVPSSSKRFIGTSGEGTSLLTKLGLSHRCDSIAVIDGSGCHSYGELFRKSTALSNKIKSLVGDSSPSAGRNVAFLAPNDHTYLVTLLAIWMARCAAVPLCRSYPADQLAYYVEDCGTTLLVSAGSDAEERLARGLTDRYDLASLHLSAEFDPYGGAVTEEAPAAGCQKEDPALILYTSGTTGPPKGVVLSHGNLTAQTSALVQAWGVTTADTNLHVLPLHHLHGVVGALLTPLSAGGAVHMLPRFDAAEVWNNLASRDSTKPKVNTFMAVPTMYSKLLEDYNIRFSDNPAAREFIYAVCKENIRLMVSGSSALSDIIFERWENVTGHTLLERYGMSEIGLVLSNPLMGQRRKGFVGTPVPGVEVCIATPNAYSPIGYNCLLHANNIMGIRMESESLAAGPDWCGELYVRGPTVFSGYWKRLSDTKKSFTVDGWFKTGDIASADNGSLRILGRSSVDIIKSGGFKIGALDVEAKLSRHPSVKECSVVGVEDVTWGQTVAAIVVTKTGSSLSAEALREWCKTVMPKHSVPTLVKFVEEIPRNAMGKINKRDLVRLYFPS